MRTPLAAGRVTARGFSLIEVVAAVAIFAIGMVAVLGLLAPVAKSVSTVAEAEAAARAAAAVRARLQTLAAADFTLALALVQDPAAVRAKDADGAYNPNDGTKHPAVLFGRLSGDIGLYDATRTPRGWYDSSVPTPRVVADAEKFFEIDLIRNETLSPKAGDETAPQIAYAVRVRWPAFLAAPGGGFVQVGLNQAGGGPVPYDHGKKQALFFSGSIQR
jgi:prepilin-type N-terminal cleavage/methylation domain-containing protein